MQSKAFPSLTADQKNVSQWSKPTFVQKYHYFFSFFARGMTYFSSIRGILQEYLCFLDWKTPPDLLPSSNVMGIVISSHENYLVSQEKHLLGTAEEKHTEPPLRPLCSWTCSMKKNQLHVLKALLGKFSISCRWNVPVR